MFWSVMEYSDGGELQNIVTWNKNRTCLVGEWKLVEPAFSVQKHEYLWIAVRKLVNKVSKEKGSVRLKFCYNSCDLWECRKLVEFIVSDINVQWLTRCFWWAKLILRVLITLFRHAEMVIWINQASVFWRRAHQGSRREFPPGLTVNCWLPTELISMKQQALTIAWGSLLDEVINLLN